MESVWAPKHLNMSGSTSQILCGAHGFQKTSPTAINNDCIMERRSRDVSKANGVLAECWKTLAETESERQRNRRRKREKREKDGKRERERAHDNDDGHVSSLHPPEQKSSSQDSGTSR